MKRSTRARSRVLVGVMALGLAAAPMAVAAAPAAPPSQPGAQGAAAMRMNYVINIAKGKSAHLAKVKKAVKSEGGVVLSTYKRIGVVVAQSSTAGFAAALRDDHADVVKSVGATRTAEAPPPKAGLDDPNRLAKLTPDPREGEQWGNTMLQSLKANEHQPGSKDVLVGVLDSGVDTTHPDLVANFNRAASADCTQNGVVDSSDGSWLPTASTHGTHVAGTIAAARDGEGIAGIAPNVSYASIKVGNDDGFIYPEYALCGFMWAASHGVDVTNNSYFVDPWAWWCKDDPDQSAVQKAFKKLLRYTTNKKDIVTVVAAGNSGLDLNKVTSDSSSPNDGTPVTRPINKGCKQIPGQMKGVVKVASVTSTGAKSSFSNYGLGQINVAAPGSSILSTTWPGHGWGYLSGTSMASPHVAGVVALIRSEYPSAGAAAVISILEDTAVATACPDGTPQCEGDKDNNGYYGHGIVNALNAVS